MQFLVIAHDKPDNAARRAEVRPKHLAHVSNYPGWVKLGGPFLDKSDNTTPRGSFIVIEADSIDDVQKMMAVDPYWTDGVFEKVEVLPALVTVGEWKPKE